MARIRDGWKNWTLEEFWHATKVCLMAAALSIFWIILFSVWCSSCRAENVAVYTVAYESSGETMEGQIAVASVIKTRMAQRHQSAEKVCLAPYQFSCWKNGIPTQKRKLSDAEIEKSRKAWEMAKAGKFNHYARFDCKPSWIKAAKSSKRIGNHVFYEL